LFQRRATKALYSDKNLISGYSCTLIVPNKETHIAPSRPVLKACHFVSHGGAWGGAGCKQFDVTFKYLPQSLSPYVNTHTPAAIVLLGQFSTYICISGQYLKRYQNKPLGTAETAFCTQLNILHHDIMTEVQQTQPQVSMQQNRAADDFCSLNNLLQYPAFTATH